jgi:hypothetical protein
VSTVWLLQTSSTHAPAGIRREVQSYAITAGAAGAAAGADDAVPEQGAAAPRDAAVPRRCPAAALRWQRSGCVPCRRQAHRRRRSLCTCALCCMLDCGPHVLRLRCESGSSPAHVGRKKLKRRAARDDSSESNGGTDPGNQLVQYQGGSAGGNGPLDIPDFFNGLMALDDSGDSAGLRRDQPSSLVEVGTTALHVMLGHVVQCHDTADSTIRQTVAACAACTS